MLFRLSETLGRFAVSALMLFDFVTPTPIWLSVVALRQQNVFTYNFEWRTEPLAREVES